MNIFLQRRNFHVYFQIRCFCWTDHQNLNHHISCCYCACPFLTIFYYYFLLNNFNPFNYCHIFCRINIDLLSNLDYFHHLHTFQNKSRLNFNHFHNMNSYFANYCRDSDCASPHSNLDHLNNCFSYNFNFRYSIIIDRFRNTDFHTNFIPFIRRIFFEKKVNYFFLSKNLNFIFSSLINGKDIDYLLPCNLGYWIVKKIKNLMENYCSQRFRTKKPCRLLLLCFAFFSSLAHIPVIPNLS